MVTLPRCLEAPPLEVLTHTGKRKRLLDKDSGEPSTRRMALGACSVSLHGLLLSLPNIPVIYNKAQEVTNMEGVLEIRMEPF